MSCLLVLYTHPLFSLNIYKLHDKFTTGTPPSTVLFHKLSVTLSPSFIGARGRRVPSVGQQVLPRPRRRGRGQHYASHFHQELLGRHQSHHTADAVP